MTRTLTAVAAALVALAAGGAAAAHPHGNGNGNGNGRGHEESVFGDQDHPRGHSGFDEAHHDNGRHLGWRKGGHIERNDWSRGERIDWRHQHLRQPPAGYEWRRIDGTYVLAAPRNGLIASIIANLR